MCKECLLENNDVDDLLEQYKKQKREIYINDTLSARTKLDAIADAIADSCEAEYRANPTYKNEKNMRYWRYKAAQHTYEGEEDYTYAKNDAYGEYEFLKKRYIRLTRRHGNPGGITEGEKAALFILSLFGIPSLLVLGMFFLFGLL
jgi:hypothetical protein